MVNDNTAHSKAVYKYFLKAIYNRANKKEYNSQIWQYNRYNRNMIVMKGIITVIEKIGENKNLLIIENIDKTIMIKFAKVSNVIDLGNKHN